MEKNDEDDLKVLLVREKLNFKQDRMGLLMGMGKQAISRLEKKHRKETFQHKATLSLISFLEEKDLLNEYVEWRFGFPVNRNFYKK